MTVRVHALTETDWLRPWGECYAPQVVLTSNRGFGNWDVHELNTEQFLPLSAPWVAEIFEKLSSAMGSRARTIETMQRYFRAFYDMDMSYHYTTGFSQGDWGHSFVFAPKQWLELVGAPGIDERDHIDFCAWLWGDVYEVFDDEATGTERYKDSKGNVVELEVNAREIVYGMDEAMKYGEITFPTERTVISYEY